MSSKTRRSIGRDIQIDPSNLARTQAQLKEMPFITEDEIRKIWGDGLVGSLLRHNLEMVRQFRSSKREEDEADFDSDDGYEEGRGRQAKRQPRTKAGKRRRDDEEWDQGTGRGQKQQKRRRDSDGDDSDDDEFNRRGDRRGWNAKVQPRRASGQFKKTGEEDELSDDEGGGGGGRKQSRRRRSRSRSVDSDTGGQIGRPRRQRASVEHDEDDLNRHGDFRGWNAKVQPRRATGQFKKSDEEDELSGDERGGGRGRNQQSRRRRSRSRSVESNSGRGGQGSAARFLPRTATGQLKPKGEPDELGQRRQRDYDNGGEQIGRPRRRRTSNDLGEEDLNRQGDFRGWQAKEQPRRASGQFKKTGEDDELSDNDGGGRGRKQQRGRRSRSRSVDSDRGGNRSGAGQGSAARFLPRTETGQFKKKGEPDDLGRRDDSDEDQGGRRGGGNQSRSGDDSGRGNTARSLPRTETGQFKKKGEQDELSQKKDRDDQGGRGSGQGDRSQESGNRGGKGDQDQSGDTQSKSRTNTNRNEAQRE